MTFKELWTQWESINQAINTGALHETAADDVLHDMVDAYREENNLYEDGEPYDFGVVFDILVDERLKLLNKEKIK